MNTQKFLAVIIVILFCNCSTPLDNQYSGAYLGLNPPGNEPEVFAPGFITTSMYTRDLAMTPDGNEIYFCIVAGINTYSTILVTRFENGYWTRPEVAEFARDRRYTYIEPFINTDGNKFYFASNMPKSKDSTNAGDWDIWVMDKTENSWGSPYNLGPPVNDEHDQFFPSLTRDGTIYYTQQEGRSNRIFRSNLKSGKYSEPEVLGPEVNSGRARFNAYINPDEEFLILSVFGLDDSFGGTDYYVCFRDPNDSWSQPVNLGNRINTNNGFEFSPYISPDGKYFFFMSTRVNEDNYKGESFSFDALQHFHANVESGNPGMYWVDASFIKELKPAD